MGVIGTKRGCISIEIWRQMMRKDERYGSEMYAECEERVTERGSEEDDMEEIRA
jgi:hypothetical protein